VTGIPKRHVGVLLRKQKRHLFLAIKVADDFENVLDDKMGKSH
jgi:hypothetical protein